MIIVNANVNNLKLQRNLNTVNSAMQNALNRISTGYKINNASDDAAGLVISKALDAQNRGLNVANQNAQMATNLLSVADGALGQMSDLAMRIRDLATQSANGVYSDAERKAISLEAKELTNNLEQLVKGTKFNDYDIFKSTGASPTKAITTEEEAIKQGYEIVKTAQELKAALNAPDILDNSNKKVMLFGDIDLDELGIVDGNNWVAVGGGSNSFKGIFDGNGYTISNLKINSPSAGFQGFFGRIEGALIKNTALEDIDVKGLAYTGGLVGGLYSSSIIQNSYSTGNVTGTTYTGGLAGYLYSSSIIQNSYSAGNVTGITSVGGFVGCLNGSNSSIKNSYSACDVFSSNTSGSSSKFGGFVGEVWNNALISNSYSTGQNKATIGNRGGFIGEIGKGYTITLDNYAYATQTTGGVANGNGVGLNEGAIIGKEQTSGQNEAFFNTASNVQNLLDKGIGVNQWDFTILPPKLKWQTSQKGTPITFQIGTDGSNLSAISIDLSFTLGNFKPNFSTAETSRATMEMCDALLKQINTKRGEIGANTNIISSIIDGNTITNENLTASKSRIQDVDIARESAIMVKNQILEQATTSLLSQSSNINGQLALQLLSGLGVKM